MCPGASWAVLRVEDACLLFDLGCSLHWGCSFWSRVVPPLAPALVELAVVVVEVALVTPGVASSPCTFVAFIGDVEDVGDVGDVRDVGDVEDVGDV